VTTVIKIRPSPTADTRTCDWSKVTRETLLASSEQHIRDIRAGLAFFAGMLGEAGIRHDHDKITAIDHFHADFRTGFAQTGWWDNHRKVNRHHLTEADGIPADVNLIDVLDFITDCVMAGMARSGSVRPLTVDPAVLQRAFENTAALLCANVEIAHAEEARAPLPDGRDATPQWMPGGAFCHCGHVEFMVPGPAAVRCEHRGTDPVLHTPIECRTAMSDEIANLHAVPAPRATDDDGGSR
jgi:hypothetical protein